MAKKCFIVAKDGNPSRQYNKLTGFFKEPNSEKSLELTIDAVAEGQLALEGKLQSVLPRALEVYSKLYSNKFKEFFGDWLNNPNDTMILNDQGEPVIKFDKNFDTVYVLNQNGKKFSLYNTPFEDISEKQLFIDIANGLMGEIVKQSDLLNKNFDDVKVNIDELIEKSINESDLDNETKGFLLNYKKDLTSFINSRFNSIAVKIDQEVDKTDESRIDSNLNIAESITKNFKDNASRNTKLLLNFSAPIYDKNGEPVKSALGHQLYHDFAFLYSRLLPLIAGQMTTVNTNGEIKSRFDKILDIIKKESLFDNSFVPFYEMLNNLPDYKKEQFSQAFALKKENFVESEIDISDDGYSYINRSSYVNSAADKFETLLADGFRRNFVDIKNENNEIVFYYKKQPPVWQSAVRGDTADDIFTRAVDWLIELGFNQNEIEIANALQKYLTINQYETNWLNSRFNNINETIQSSFTTNNGEISRINFINPLKGKKGVVKGEKFFREFSEIFASLKPEYNDHTVNLSEGKGYSYTPQSNIWSMIEMLKAKDEVLMQNSSLPLYNKVSVYEDITESDFKEFLVTRFNRLKTTEDGDNGVDNSSMGLVDAVFDSIHRTALNDLPNMLANADKSSLLFIKGFRRYTTILNEQNQLSVDSRTVSKLYDLLQGEVERINAVKEFKENNPIVDGKVPNDWVLYYHYNIDKNGNITAGNAEKLVIFEFLQNELENLTEDLIFNDITKPRIKQIIANYFQNRINEVKESFNEIGMYDNNGQLRMANELKNKIHVDVRLNFSSKSTPEEKAAIKKAAEETLIAGWYLENYIHNVETALFLNGDPAYYKNKIDFLKRVPAAYIDGLSIDVTNQEERYYNVSVVKSIITPSLIKYSDDQMQAIANATGETLSEIKKQFGASGTYTKEDANNIADAQAWSTIDRWEFLMRKTYGIAPSTQEIIDDIKAGNKLTAVQTSNLLKVMSAQPVKGVHFQIINGTPRYLKYSLMPLIPQMIQDSELEMIERQMRIDGIDELVTLDGIKVGAEGISEINNGENLKPEVNGTTKGLFHPIQMDNRFWRLQQQLASKQIKDGDLGSQLQKNVLGNLDYTKPEDRAKARNILKAVSELMKQQQLEFAKEYGVTVDKDGSIEWSSIDRDKLIYSLSKSIRDQDLVDSLKKGIEIEALPNLKATIQAVLSSKLKSVFVKIGINQAQMIQVSNFGTNKLSKESKKGIYWLKDETTLSMPEFKTRKDGSNYVVPGQILIPHHIIAKYIPDYKELTPEQLNKRVDSQLLTAIGYRIPNQGMSSIDALEVVGILPPEAGDSIVVYTGLTTKTGSDFDIDKMFMFLPDFKVNSNTINNFRKKLSKKSKKDLLDYYFNEVSKNDVINKTFERLLESYDKESLTSLIIDELLGGNSEFAEAFRNDKTAELRYVNSKGNSLSAKRNQLYESYWAVITDPANYMELTASIDEPTEKIKESLTDPNFKDRDVFDPLMQLDYKNKLKLGKAGLGFVANHLVTHKMSQLFELYYDGLMQTLNESFGFENSNYAFLGAIKNTENYKIDQILSGYMNLFVDIAKDPKIAESNYNLSNMSTAMALIRMGVSDTVVSKMLQSDALKTLSRFEAQRNSRIINSFDVVPRDKVIETLFGDIKNEPSPDDLTNDAEASKYIEFDERGNMLFKPTVEMFDSLNPNVQYIVFEMFNYLKTSIAKDISSVNKATKIDTDGYGSFESNKVLFFKKLVDALHSRIGNVDKLFNANHSDNPSFVGAKALNELFSTTDIASTILSNASMSEFAFIAAVQDMLGVNSSFENDKLEWIAKAIYVYKNSESPLYKINDFKALFATKRKEGKTLFERIERAKEMLAKKNIENFFLDSITPFVQGAYTFLEIEAAISKNPDFLRMLKNAWTDLTNATFLDKLNLSDEVKESYRQGFLNLSLDIAKHQFYATGFSGGINSFYDALPDSIVLHSKDNESNHNEYIKTAEVEYDYRLLDNIARNNINALEKISKKRSEELLRKFLKTRQVSDAVINKFAKNIIVSDKKLSHVNLKGNVYRAYTALGDYNKQGDFIPSLYVYHIVPKYGLTTESKRKIVENVFHSSRDSMFSKNNRFVTGPETTMSMTDLANMQTEQITKLLETNANLKSNVRTLDMPQDINSKIKYYNNTFELLYNVLTGNMTQSEFNAATQGFKVGYQKNKKAVMTKDSKSFTPKESKQQTVVQQQTETTNVIPETQQSETTNELDVNQQKNVQEQSKDPMLNYQSYVNFVNSINKQVSLDEASYNALKQANMLSAHIDMLNFCKKYTI